MKTIPVDCLPEGATPAIEFEDAAERRGVVWKHASKHASAALEQGKLGIVWKHASKHASAALDQGCTKGRLMTRADGLVFDLETNTLYEPAGFIPLG